MTAGVYVLLVPVCQIGSLAWAVQVPTRQNLVFFHLLFPAREENTSCPVLNNEALMATDLFHHPVPGKKIFCQRDVWWIHEVKFYAQEQS